MKRALTVLVAILLAVALTGCLGRHKPLSQQPGYGRAHYDAQLYCSMAVNDSIYGDAMTRCIRQKTVEYMKARTP